MLAQDGVFITRYQLPTHSISINLARLSFELARLEISLAQIPNSYSLRKDVKGRRDEKERERGGRETTTKETEMRVQKTKRERERASSPCPVIIGGQDGWWYLFALALRN